MGNRCADHVTPLYPQKLALTLPTGGGRFVGIVHSRTKAMEFSFFSLENPIITVHDTLLSITDLTHAATSPPNYSHTDVP